jgi:hypothetical protein
MHRTPTEKQEYNSSTRLYHKTILQPQTSAYLLSRNTHYGERKSSMLATTFEIVDKPRERAFRPGDIRNFRLGEMGQLPG